MRYRAFNLSIESELALSACPEPTESAASPDVRIIRGSVLSAVEVGATTPLSPLLDVAVVNAGHWVLAARGHDPADRWTADITANRIEMGWTRGVEEGDVARIITTVVLAACAFVRRCACLHGSMVQNSRGQTLVILGSSGAGKSTLAAALIAAGARMITEEIIVLDRENPRLVPSGVPILKVSESTASYFGFHEQTKPAFLHADYRSDGVAIELDPMTQFLHRPGTPIDAVYLLAERYQGSAAIVSAPLPVADAAANLASAGYWMTSLSGDAQAIVRRAALVIASGVPVRRLQVPDGLDRLPAAVAGLCDGRVGGF